MNGENFWDHHGVFFLIFVTVFPRLTLLFATPWGGLLWWLGWLFLPRLTVAILATTYYWEQNAILCIIAWFLAIPLEFGEKSAPMRYSYVVTEYRQ